MCGIVGVFSTRSYGMAQDEVKALYNLVIADSARGEDGTGMYWMDCDGKRWYWKEAKTAGECMNKRIMRDFLDDARLAVCHNRAATLGAVDKESTHPFSTGNIIGVHNGTVSGWKAAFPEAKSTMDSMAIFEALEDTDPDPEAVNEVLKKIDAGAYALVWHDMRVNELRLVRNSDRPLYIVSTRDAMWFGSEIRMLEWALYRNTETPVSSFKLDPHLLLCVPDGGGEAATHVMTSGPKYAAASKTVGYKGDVTTYDWATGRYNGGAINRFGTDDYDQDSLNSEFWNSYGGLL